MSDFLLKRMNKTKLTYGAVVHVHGMKAYGGIAPLILNLDTKGGEYSALPTEKVLSVPIA
jgi:hypothetical protein